MDNPLHKMHLRTTAYIAKIEADNKALTAENGFLKKLLNMAECPNCVGNGVIITGHCVGHLTDGLKSKPCGFCKQRKEVLK